MRIFIHDYAGHPFPVELSRELARRGHNVLHAFFRGDQGPKGLLAREPGDGTNLVFSPVRLRGPYEKTSLIKRRFDDLEYGRAVASVIASERPDVVISGNTPTEAQHAIIAACKDVSAAFVFWMQDFYSIAAELILKKQLGAIGAVVGAYYKHLERRQLQQSDSIVVITDDFRVLASEWSCAPKKVFTIENWGARGNIRPAEKSNLWSARHGLDNSFNFLYSGTLGLKHNPALLVALARHMRERAKIVIVSSGSGVDELSRQTEDGNLQNLIILPLQEYFDFPNVLATADVSVAMIEKEAGIFSVPSKVLSYLCSGRPILLAAPSENLAARLVKQQRAGAVVEAEDVSGFLRAADELMQDSASRAEMGANGAAYAAKTYDIGAIADQFMRVFDTALSNARRRRAPKS